MVRYLVLVLALATAVGTWLVAENSCAADIAPSRFPRRPRLPFDPKDLPDLPGPEPTQELPKHDPVMPPAAPPEPDLPWHVAVIATGAAAAIYLARRERRRLSAAAAAAADPA